MVSFDGHSDYGNALEVFARGGRGRWPERRCWCSGTAAPTTDHPGVPVLVDLVPAGPVGALAEPGPAGCGGAGTRRPTAYGEVIEMVELRNAAQLADFVTTL